jgi:hypothetical protein
MSSKCHVVSPLPYFSFSFSYSFLILNCPVTRTESATTKVASHCETRERRQLPRDRGFSKKLFSRGARGDRHAGRGQGGGGAVPGLGIVSRISMNASGRRIEPACSRGRRV